MALLLFVAAFVFAVAVRLCVLALRRRRMAAEVRGDWWPRFEQQFHDYASASWQSAREAERER
jgi:hypothetical protein